MKRFPSLIMAFFFIVFAMICAMQVARGQDPVKVAPDNYKVIYENDTVRILEYNDVPGTKIKKHSHPNYFVYVINDAKRLFVTDAADPECTGGTKAKVILTADEKIPSNGTLKDPVTHCEENIGYTNTRLIVVEFKLDSKTETKTTTAITITQQQPD